MKRGIYSKKRFRKRYKKKHDSEFSEQMNLRGEKVKLDEIQEMAKARGIAADKIPNEFTGDVTNTERIKDSFGRDCLNATVQIEGMEGLATIKYTPMHLEELAKSLVGLKVDEFKGKFKFVKKDFGIGYPRPIPTERVE